MITIAIPSSRCRRSISARICACTVTSSAVVGSSAISSFGSFASAIAIIARWRMPPENSCGYSSTRRAGSGMPTSPSSSIARARACALETSRCARTASISCAPTLYSGCSADSGSWKIIAMSLPRIARSSFFGQRHQVLALEQDPPRDARPLRGA